MKTDQLFFNKEENIEQALWPVVVDHGIYNTLTQVESGKLNLWNYHFDISYHIVCSHTSLCLGGSSFKFRPKTVISGNNRKHLFN